MRPLASNDTYWSIDSKWHVRFASCMTICWFNNTYKICNRFSIRADTHTHTHTKWYHYIGELSFVVEQAEKVQSTQTIANSVSFVRFNQIATQHAQSQGKYNIIIVIRSNLSFATRSIENNNKKFRQNGSSWNIGTKIHMGSSERAQQRRRFMGGHSWWSLWLNQILERGLYIMQVPSSMGCVYVCARISILLKFAASWRSRSTARECGQRCDQRFWWRWPQQRCHCTNETISYRWNCRWRKESEQKTNHQRWAKEKSVYWCLFGFGHWCWFSDPLSRIQIIQIHINFVNFFCLL